MLCQAAAQLVEAELEADDNTRMREARRPPLRPTRRLATDRTGSLDAERAQRYRLPHLAGAQARGRAAVHGRG